MFAKWICPASSRIDAFMAAQLSEVSRNRIKAAIKNGAVELNGEVCTKPATKLKVDDEVVLLEDPGAVNEVTVVEPVDLDLVVLYEDDDCLVVNKPAGYAVHPAPGVNQSQATILHGVAWLFKQRQLPFEAGTVLVHRLDKDTTGCLLIAKTPTVHSQLQKQFQDRDITKIYLALVAGCPQPTQALIDAPIGRSLNDRTKMSVLQTSTSRPALTAYKLLEATDSVSLLECDLKTGRTHQIRVHLESIGHPILGDSTYFNQRSRQLSKTLGTSSICLHALKLSFMSPTNLQVITVEAPLARGFLAILDKLRIEN